ncbi:MAG: arsenate reductase ArsC [Clostridia bacterium]|nr:arsenate reductase ArsC [Clostridia bacterium]
MKYKVAFICVHNSCRSQMAEGWAKALGKNIFDVYSAGTEDYPEVKPLAVEVMEEAGIDMSEHHPKLLSDIPEELDILITMGCNVVCPFVPNQHMEDWGLDDPSGGPIEGFRVTRDLIKKKVEELIQRVEEGEINLHQIEFK